MKNQVSAVSDAFMAWMLFAMLAVRGNRLRAVEQNQDAFEVAIKSFSVQRCNLRVDHAVEIQLATRCLWRHWSVAIFGVKGIEVRA